MALYTFVTKFANAVALNVASYWCIVDNYCLQKMVNNRILSHSFMKLLSVIHLFAIKLYLCCCKTGPLQ